MATPHGGMANSSSVPTINLPAARTHANTNVGNSHASSTTFSRESSLGPAGSDTSESSVDSSNQLKPRKLFRIRSRAGEITFGKLMTQPQVSFFVVLFLFSFFFFFFVCLFVLHFFFFYMKCAFGTFMMFFFSFLSLVLQFDGVL